MSKNEERWLENCKYFKGYVVRNCKLPEKGVVSSLGIDLESWFSNQRKAFKDGKLDNVKVNYFESILKGMLLKSKSDINLELFRYKKFNTSKYNPDINYLVGRNAIDLSLYKLCVKSEIYFLADIIEKLIRENKNPNIVFYNCIRTVCTMPRYGVCSLYCAVTGEKDIVSLYKKDHVKFVNYYSRVIDSFEDDYETIVLETGLSDRPIGIIDMYFGLSDKPCTKREIGVKYGIVEKKINEIMSDAIKKISVMATYDANGDCTFGNHHGNMARQVKSNPLTRDFSEFEEMSVRAKSCMKRAGINNFNDLHKYLISVHDGNNNNYAMGMSKIRNLGARAAREVYDLAYKLGVGDKVFKKE